MLLNLKEGEYLGQKLKSINNSFFTLSITGYDPNYKILKHNHDNDYISILVNGQYHEKSAVENNLISPGDILFRPNFYTHENLFESFGGTCFNIEFKPEWQRKLGFSLALPNKFTNYKTGKFPSLYKLLLNFKNENNEDLSYEFICDWIFQLNQSTLAKGTLPWLEKIIRIIENETECFHSLQSLSERMFVHPIYIARAFKERQGITVGEYQIKIKLANSVLLLLNTSLSINEIAHKNGFFDDAHFIRTFKSVYNISPHQFRLSIKKLI